MNLLVRDIARARNLFPEGRYHEHTSSTGDLAIRENGSSPRERPDRAAGVAINHRDTSAAGSPVILPPHR
jgi:hypothetical protein